MNKVKRSACIGLQTISVKQMYRTRACPLFSAINTGDRWSELIFNKRPSAGERSKTNRQVAEVEYSILNKVVVCIQHARHGIQSGTEVQRGAVQGFRRNRLQNGRSRRRLTWRYVWNRVAHNVGFVPEKRVPTEYCWM